MSIPGFTAEKALSTTKEFYEGTAIFTGPGEIPSLVPAFCVGGMCCTCTDYGCVCFPKRGHVLM